MHAFMRAFLCIKKMFACSVFIQSVFIIEEREVFFLNILSFQRCLTHHQVIRIHVFSRVKLILKETKSEVRMIYNYFQSQGYAVSPQ